MQITLWKTFVEGALPDGVPQAIKQHFWHTESEDKDAFVEMKELSKKTIDALYDYAYKTPDHKNSPGIIKTVFAWRELQAKPLGQKISALTTLKDALEAYAANKDHHGYFFYQHEDGNLVPYAIKKVERVPKNEYDDTHVCLTLVHHDIYYNDTYHGEKGLHTKTVDWYSHHVKKTTLAELLATKSLYAETESMYNDWVDNVARFKELQARDGLQVIATGFVTTSKYGGNWVDVDLRATECRCVVDNFELRPPGEKHGRTKYRDEVVYPMHPYIRCFDFKTHGWLFVHINQVAKYKYNPKIAENLVLNPATTGLIDDIIANATELQQDIVKGKSGGLIFMSTGVPGTGKTLTAEIYAEKVSRPLYTVQAAQLGLSVDEVEKNLDKALSRAVRWNAILLIDEADVFIFKRGKDMKQNAVVGVFLRMLEGYDGILFMTSNRHDIDDAILSRAIAHIRYVLPTLDELTTIFHIQCKQYKLDTNLPLCAKVAAKYVGQMSGRDAKNVTRLLGIIKRPFTMDNIDFITKYQDLAKPDSNGEK